MICCRNCNTANADSNSQCSSCEASLLIAVLECILSSDERVEQGTQWGLFGKDYTVGRSLNNDIVISGEFVSRQHFMIKYNVEEKVFYYESIARNLLDFEKQTYKILDGAIIPLPETIELKFSYL